MKMIKSKLLALAVNSLVVSTASAQDVWIPFDNFGPFSTAQFLFTNEQGAMDVSYANNRMTVSGGFARLQAGRNAGDSAYGVWSKTGNIAPVWSYTHARARCEAATGRPNTHNWSAFWTLFDGATNEATKNLYYENDIMETRTGGAYFNRYTVQNADGSIVTAGGQLLFTDKAWWRDNFREYRCTLGAANSTFTVTGASEFSHTISGNTRTQSSQLLLTNRPWGASLNSVPQNTRIADLVVDYIWLNVP